MANVTKRASRQFTVQDSGTATHTLPTGSVAGDLLLAWCEDGGRRSNRPADTTGWTSSAHAFGALWSKRLTAADITAGSVTLLGEVTGLLACVNGSGIGQRRDGHQITRSVAGAAVVVTAFAPPSASTVNPTGDRLDSVVDHEDWPHTWYFLPGDGAAGLKGLSGVDSGASYFAWEILPVVGPNAPTLSTPLAGAQVDVAAPTVLTLVHNSTSGAVQAALEVRVREVGTGTWYYVKADGTLTAPTTTLTQAASTVTIAAGQLTATKLYEWCARTQDESTWSDWSPTQEFRAVAKPTITDVAVTVSAGDLSPLVQATWTMGYGTPAWWRVRITPSASGAADVGTVYDSGIIGYTGLQEVVVPPADGDAADLRWTNGATYRAWVEVAQAGGLASDPTQDASTFTVSWTAPSTPSAVTVAQGTPARVTISNSVMRDGWELEWDPTNTGTWEAYASAVQSGSGSIYVYVPLVPYASPVHFRARVFTLSEGQRLRSGWRETASTFTSTDTRAYLVDPDNLSTYVAVRLAEDRDREPLQGVTVSLGHGATAPRVDSTEVQGWTGLLALSTRTLAEHDALVTWLTGKARWWVRWAPERDAFGAQTRVHRASTLMTRAKTPGVDRIGDGPLSNRVVALRWVSQ